MVLAQDIRNPLLRQLYDDWQARRAGRRFPARADFDPIDMRDLLGSILLVEVLRDPLRFRMRLHGTRMAERAGYDLTGRMLDDLPDPEFRELARRSFTTVVETGEPLLSHKDRQVEHRRFRYETIMLPLSDDGETVNMLMVALLYLDR